MAGRPTASQRGRHHPWGYAPAERFGHPFPASFRASERAFPRSPARGVGRKGPAPRHTPGKPPGAGNPGERGRRHAGPPGTPVGKAPEHLCLSGSASGALSGRRPLGREPSLGLGHGGPVFRGGAVRPPGKCGTALCQSPRGPSSRSGTLRPWRRSEHGPVATGRVLRPAPGRGHAPQSQGGGEKKSLWELWWWKDPGAAPASPSDSFRREAAEGCCA